ncbi:hypothetical protein BRADI_2g38928v3 [Brachypodium distachyon]|uniref:NB-ARC domain-containing protein n=1 Tax=Brachypodium distachyon TaxID=15368 RepID=A0A2K2DCP3_BRADI|nr:hypothetical protein BRADI_2g38928v3 [Brachypodium distachyon]
MEATAMSVGKAVLDGALDYAKSKAAEEIVLQLGVKRDVDFITDELQMMQSFLMMADEEQSQNKVLTTWVKQIRNLAYKVEDSIMDFGLQSEKKPFMGCIPCSLCDQCRIAKEVKELRVKVEDVSNRNLRYHLIKESSGSKPAVAEEQARVASAAIFGINEASLSALEKDEPKVDFHQLITSNDVDLRVIAVWGTTGDLGKTSAIQEVYDDPNIGSNFGFRAWMENMSESEMIDVFDSQVSDNSYLIVIDDLSTIVEWSCIKRFFPDNKKQSRIIVSSQQAEIASLCTEQPYQVSELKQLSSDQTLYLFHKKVMNASRSAALISESSKVTTAGENITVPASEIQDEYQQPKKAGEDKACNSTARKKTDRSRTPALVDELLTGRETEKSVVIKLVCQPDNNQGCKVISVWGMGGLGKTTLVRSVYRSQELDGWKRVWATALRPFNPEQLERKKSIALMKLQELKVELTRLLRAQKCLIVLDDISSTFEWELVKGYLYNAGRIIVTTREKNIAEHCSRGNRNTFGLGGLKHDAALDLFIKKENSDKNNLIPAMMDQASLILRKCNGLPLAISTIGGFLASKPKTAIEWRKMNGHISSELEVNPELKTIKTVLMKSYDGLPYHLKSAFLYLSIFPEDHRIRWDRLVRRWMAEGYSRDMHGMTAEELGRMYFDELLDRSMILPVDQVKHNSGKINSCQLHDIIREICISKVREENLVLTLEKDLEDTVGLRDHHLDQIGQLHHLMYISLRECINIFFLPNSLGNLRHLQTLDVRGTRIFELPASITKLRKLQHLRTTYYMKRRNNVKGEDDIVLNYYRMRAPFLSTKLGWAFLRPQVLDADLNRLDILNLYRFNMVYLEETASHDWWVDGVEVPGGIGKLEALHTLDVVNIARGKVKATLNELKKLIQLCKVGVTGAATKTARSFGLPLLVTINFDIC